MNTITITVFLAAIAYARAGLVAAPVAVPAYTSFAYSPAVTKVAAPVAYAPTIAKVPGAVSYTIPFPVYAPAPFVYNQGLAKFATPVFAKAIAPAVTHAAHVVV
ncbi:unnamed protein product [Allacma fusca]|uniref:Cuticle protein n=1 Tax=Allacma fusca TaxID=39272 RepID=A0A8J2K242_9HEXA|nr:unnamed protein product [Allacma fusca]